MAGSTYFTLLLFCSFLSLASPAPQRPPNSYLPPPPEVEVEVLAGSTLVHAKHVESYWTLVQLGSHVATATLTHLTLLCD